MPTEDPLQRFRDIIENIDLISDFTSGLSREQYENDVKTRLAVERRLRNRHRTVAIRETNQARHKK